MADASAASDSPRAHITRRTSRAVTMPSPEVVCSRTMTCPLFSPPRVAPDTCIPSRMYLSPTGVRMTWPPAASTADWSPPFERTETTSPPPGNAPRASRSSARMPEDLVAVDDPAGRVDRDEAIRVAVEGEPDVGAEPDDGLAPAMPDPWPRSRTLMLMPSGSAWMTSTVRPGRLEDAGPRIEPDPLAPSRTTRSPAAGIAVGQAEPVLAVAPRRARRASTTRPSPAFPTPPSSLGPPDQLLELVLDRVVELEAVAVEHLEAVVVGRVVRGGDHDPGRERPASRPGTRGPASARRRRHGRRRRGSSRRPRSPPRTCPPSGGCPGRRRARPRGPTSGAPSPGRGRRRGSA